MGRLDLLEKVALEARAYYESRSLEDLTHDAQMDLAVSWSNIGHVLEDQGHLDEALSSFSASLEIKKVLVATHPSATTWKGNLANSHAHIGSVLREQGDLEGALQSHASALEIRRELAAGNPTSASWQRDVASSYDKIGGVLRERGDLDGALESRRRAPDIFEELATRDPTDASLKGEVSRMHTNLGRVLRDRDDLEDALEHHSRSLEIRAELVAQDPTSASRKMDLSDANENLAYTLQEAGSYGESVAAFSDFLEDQAARSALSHPHLYDAARSAALAAGSGEDEAAEEWRRQALAWLGEELEMRYGRVAEIEAEIRTADLGSSTADELTAELQGHRDQLERARTGDTDLAVLRQMPEFAGLFAKYDR